MPVPKKRRSKSKKRSKHAHWTIEPVMLTKCAKCSAMIVPHRACTFCGFYKGQQVIFFKEKSETKDA